MKPIHLSKPLRRAPTWMTALALALAACSGSDVERPKFAAPVEPVPLPGPPGAAPLEAPSGEPEELAGVDTSELVRRERHTWWQLVSQLYAPCSDQAVSLVQCVREVRPCPACTVGAQLIADKIRSGAGAKEAQAAYGIRFGPNVKSIEPGDSPAIGPASAPVQVIVWSDFECPACKRAMPLIDSAFERNSPGVRLIHKMYPLRAHKHSDAAARAGFAAKLQGRYWQMERLLFEHQDALEDDDLLGYAQKIGLDLARFKVDKASDKAGEVIARDRSEADQVGLTGTPFILINGREFDLGLFSLEGELDKWIATEIKLRQGAQ